jgi:hypothetical protein
MEGLAELAQSFVDLMNGITLGDLVVGVVLSLLLVPVHTFVHELGHALTAWALGHRVHELRVGDDDPLVTVRSGSFVMRLGGLTGRGEYGGYVVYDGTRASAWHELLISAAGPVASIASGLAAGSVMIAFQSHRFVLLMGLVAGLEIGVANLSASAPDGQSVRRSWRRVRSPEPAEPHEATSVAPPGYSTTSGTSSKRSTSTRPRSVILSAGITERARKESVMNGAPSRTPCSWSMSCSASRRVTTSSTG